MVLLSFRSDNTAKPKKAMPTRVLFGYEVEKSRVGGARRKTRASLLDHLVLKAKMLEATIRSATIKPSLMSQRRPKGARKSGTTGRYAKTFEAPGVANQGGTPL